MTVAESPNPVATQQEAPPAPQAALTADQLRRLAAIVAELMRHEMRIEQERFRRDRYR